MSLIGNSKKRFNTQKSIMNNGELFKMICGAGNEDAEEVYKLCLVYTLAGAKAIDIIELAVGRIFHITTFRGSFIHTAPQ